MKSLLGYGQSLSEGTSTIQSQGVVYDVEEVDGGAVGLASTRYGSCIAFWTPSQRRPVNDLYDELPAFQIRQCEGTEDQIEMIFPSGHALRLDSWVRERMKEVLERLSS